MHKVSRLWVPVVIACASCGKNDETPNGSGGGGNGGAGGAQAHGDGDGDGNGDGVSCPKLGDATNVDPQSGNELARWVYTLSNEHENPKVRQGAASGGVLLVLPSSGDEAPVMFEEHEVYSGGPLREFLTAAYINADGEVPWAHGIIPSSDIDEWQYEGASSGDALIVAMATDVAMSIAGTEANSSGDSTLVVARLTETGVDWVKTFGNVAPRPTKMAANDAGEVVLALMYDDPVDLGSGPRSCNPVILKLDAEGDAVFDRCMSEGGADFFETDGLAIDSEGAIVTSGFPTGNLDVGLGTIEIDASKGGSVLFKMASDDGRALWATKFLGAYSTHVAVRDDEIVVTGNVPNLDDDTLISDDSLAGCTGDEKYKYHLSRLDADGKRKSSTFFNGVREVHVAEDGSVYFIGPPTWGLLPDIDARDFPTLVGLRPDDSVQFIQDFQPDDQSYFFATAVLDGADNAYLVGNLTGTLTLDDGQTATGTTAAVVSVGLP